MVTNFIKTYNRWCNLGENGIIKFADGLKWLTNL
jgi:hypothetical protein